MKKVNSFIIAREGFNVVFSVALMAMLVLLLSDSFIMKLFVLIFLGGTVYLFKNPERMIERLEEDAIFSLCDGVVSNIETIECKGKIQGECIKLTITNRLIDAPMLRAPFHGVLSSKEHYKGAQLAAHSPKYLNLNEQAKLVFSHPKHVNSKIVVKHYLNRFDLPLSFYSTKNDTYEAGERYGFMFHGTTLIFFPSSTRLAIRPGDELKAGETILGYLQIA